MNAYSAPASLKLWVHPWLRPANYDFILGYKILHFINNEDREAPGYKTLRCTNSVASHRVYEF